MRDLKLGMCYVDKGKGFAVGSCNYEVVLCFIWILDPPEEKGNNDTLKSSTDSYHLVVPMLFLVGLKGYVDS